jgi:hypothetical protein
MELSELQTKQSAIVAKRALKEHFEFDLDLDRMRLSETRTMLNKVRGLLSEHRASKSMHNSHNSPAYLKLLMMEQALTGHYGDLQIRQAYESQIIVENEEVEKSQVVMAAQDMLNSINKMLEDIGIMSVKDLPAVVDGIENEIGVNEAQAFKDQAGAAIDGLREALQTAQSGMQGAIGTITGEGGNEEAFAAPTGAEGEEGGEALGGLEGGAEGMDIQAPEAGADAGGLPELPELPAEEPEAIGSVGRGRR